ncbi:uncharacterized protein LOC130803564 [Amaranthus tricolor]|uniref:uncharacterized protein LOC130803564 n=1 Tax=Amaranthus tricolor TaxID=29722 RepID=UPI0025839B71|nr:uncharacterized protein LOC130803564 [Amaranthus tricolor]
MSTYNNLVVLGFLLIAASGLVDASNYPRGITKQDQQMEAQLINNAVVAAKQELAAVKKAIDLIYENKNNNNNKEIMFGKSTEISSKETATDNNNLQCVVAGGPCTIFYQDGCCSGLCYPVFWLLIGICQ